MAEPETTPAARAMPCDLCGSERHDRLFEAGERRFGLPGRFAVVRCAQCGLCRTEPHPVDLAFYYPGDRYYAFRPPAQPSRRMRARIRGTYGLPPDGVVAATLARLAVSRLAPGLPPGPPGDLLDVGCGSGEMLLALREAGWRVRGLDVDGRAVEVARSAGLPVDEGDLLDSGYPAGSFDAVRFWHSLEHTRSPRAQLTEARRVLRAGGTLTIGVPNFASLLSRVTRDRWFYLDLPRHLWHFDRRSLARVAAAAGFAVERVRLVSTSAPLLGTLDTLLGGRGALQDRRAVWLAVLPAAVLLDALHLGDGLELIARKRGDGA
jgi:SAM-dependent methyltransferase